MLKGSIQLTHIVTVYIRNELNLCKFSETLRLTCLQTQI